MPQVTYIEADGTTHEILVEVGQTVMQAAMDNMINGITAECGGACSCATCHVFVDSAWLANLAGPIGTEKEMLDCVAEPRESSRLSCQITMRDELDGLVVHLPESQF